MQVEATMLVIERVYGDGGAKTPTIQPKTGAFESHIAFRYTEDMLYLAKLNREITVPAQGDVPTPEECRAAVAQQLFQLVPPKFNVPTASVLPDYTQPAIGAHVWSELLQKWVRQAGPGTAFAAAFELHSNATPFVRHAKVFNGGTVIDLQAGVLILVQSRNV